jgi:hypothetical protein
MQYRETALCYAYDLSETLHTLAAQVDKTPALARALRQGASALPAAQTPGARFAITSQLLVALREQLPQMHGSTRRLDALNLSLALEREHFRTATLLRQPLPNASRHTRLTWLKKSTAALYGIGLISARQWHAVQEHFATLQGDAIILQI